MPSFSVTQLRSGEGSILTRASNLGYAALGDTHPHLLEGTVVLAHAEGLAATAANGAERIDEGLFAFRGDAAKAFVRNLTQWEKTGAIFGVFRELPDADVRRRSISNPERPWDPERMKALAYAQIGPESRFAHRGCWFQEEADRRRWVEAAIGKCLLEHGVRMPHGDATLVLELPTDSTFEARFDASGSGPGFHLRRHFRSAGLQRDWTIERNEWRCLESRTERSASRSFKEHAISVLASTGIFVVSIPAFLMVAVALVIAKVTGGATPPSTAFRGGERRV